MKKGKYTESLRKTSTGKIEMKCSNPYCHRSDFVKKKLAIEIIYASYPYGNYICEHCYNGRSD